MHSVLTGPLYLKALIISTTVDAPSARKAIQLATTMEDSAFGMLKVGDGAGSQRACGVLEQCCGLLRDAAASLEIRKKFWFPACLLFFRSEKAKFLDGQGQNRPRF